MRRHDGAVDGRGAVGEVENFEEGGVVAGAEVVEPGWRSGDSVDGERWITERVGGRGLRAADVEGLW